MNDLSKFKSFAKTSTIQKDSNNDVWVYTRVSSKEQYDNHSLNNQKEHAISYAKENGYKIVHEFGGTYESASGDISRKEFQRLLAEVRKAEKKPKAILLYKINRFSRTGANGIALAKELIEDLGVHLIEVSSGKTSFKERDRLEIYSSLLSAREETLNKLDVSVPGMISFLKGGNWLGKAPRGYDHYGQRVANYSMKRENQKIVVNEEGKILRKAWSWKLKGLRDSEIRKELKDMYNLKISKQSLSSMWRNPFYCGVLIHKLLGEKVVEGNWEKLIDTDVFFQVQDIINGNHQGYNHQKQNEKFPLAGDLKCSKCQKKLTHYENKKKGLLYYKCNYCKGENLNAETTMKSKKKGAHDSFIDTLGSFKIDDKVIPLFKEQLELTFKVMNEETQDEKARLDKNIRALESDFKIIKKRYALGKIEEEIFAELKEDHIKEITLLETKMGKCSSKLSNLTSYIDNSIEICNNIDLCWKNGTYKVKKDVQKLVFPEGVMYDKENESYLTTRRNAFFELTRSISESFSENKKGQTSNVLNLSSIVDRTNRLSNQFFSSYKDIVDFSHEHKYTLIKLGLNFDANYPIIQ